MTIGPLPMMRTDLMLLSLGIFFYPEQHHPRLDGPFGQQREFQKLWDAVKLHEPSRWTGTFTTRRFSTRNPRPDLCGGGSEEHELQSDLMPTSRVDMARALVHPQSNIVSRVVVAFHGFGRPMEEMGNYLPLFDEATAMLSIGLCHHNGSTAPERERPCRAFPERFHRAIEGWLESLLPENHTEVAKELLGYSLGGRIALTLFEHAPETWSGIRLLAPDGFRKIRCTALLSRLILVE